MDHHYVFPADGGDLLGAEIERRAPSACASCPPAARWTSAGAGLPPDHVVEEIDAILDATAEAIDRHHDPSPDSMLRVGVAPCSPFSVTGDLLEQAARWPATRVSGCTPTSRRPTTRRSSAGSGSAAPPSSTSSRSAGSGPDVWLAHGVHLDDKGIAALAASGPASPTARRPTPASAPGICRTRDLRRRCPGRSRRRRRRVQRGGVAGRGGAALGAVRAGRRRASGTDRPRRPGAGHDRRRAVLGWDDQIGSLEPASSPTSRSGARHRGPRRHPRTPSPPSCSAPPPPSSLLLVQGGRGPTRRAGDRRRGTAGRRRARRDRRAADPGGGAMTGTSLERPDPRGRRARPRCARTAPQGHRRLRVRQRPVDGRHALGVTLRSPHPTPGSSASTSPRR